MNKDKPLSGFWLAVLLMAAFAFIFFRFATIGNVIEAERNYNDQRYTQSLKEQQEAAIRKLRNAAKAKAESYRMEEWR